MWVLWLLWAAAVIILFVVTFYAMIILALVVALICLVMWITAPNCHLCGKNTFIRGPKKQCSYCNHIFCEECSRECCGNFYCLEHVETHYKKCIEKNCVASFCPSRIPSSCCTCKGILCDAHKIRCKECSKTFCNRCYRQHLTNCSICARRTCGNVVCDSCRRPICSHCRVKCARCHKILCRSDSSRCPWCNKIFCKKHSNVRQENCIVCKKITCTHWSCYECGKTAHLTCLRYDGFCSYSCYDDWDD